MIEQTPSIRHLWLLVDRVAPRDDVAWERRPPLRRGRLVSQARAKQLRATVRQLAGAVSREEMPEGAAEQVETLLSAEGVDAFLELAAEGEFRDPDKQAVVGRPLSWSSLATLRDCLKILGEEAGVPEMLLPRVYREREDLAPVPTLEQSAALYRRLADMAADSPLDAVLARTLAAVGVILDTGMRSGDMVSRRLEHLDLKGRTLMVAHHRQNATHLGPPVVETARLREGTVVALRRWLEFRGRLVAGLEGADPGALWVTVRTVGTRTGGGAYAAGLPLGMRGFAVAHARGIDRLNDAMAGRWDQAGVWEPLPRRPEQLRRVVEQERRVPVG